MAVDVRRVVEIWNPVGKCSGTGYLVADDIVLTALHNVLGCGDLEVRGLDGDSTWLAAEVLWPLTEPPDLEREPQADGALVRITGPGWLPPVGAEPVRWGRIDGGPVVPDEGRLACVAVGFPRSEVRDGIRDTKEIRGHIERLTGLKSGGLITAYVDLVAVPGRRDEKSRWAGASGAALFARGRLIGVVTTDRRRDYDGDQLTAVSVVGLAARPGFVAAVGELVPEDVAAADREGARRTAYDVEVPPGVNNLPELPSLIFVGRAEVMAELEWALSAESQTITQTVHGLGGVGKTTLALHYAHDHAGAYRLVWWIRSDRPELIEAGFAALTVRLRGEEATGLTTKQAAEWAVGWLQTHPGWLLVFDNAEKPGDVHAWTGQLRASGRHLITSRYKRGWVCEPISLHVLDQEASLALLAGLIGGSEDEEDEARALVEELGHLPLALEQAGGFIAQREVSIAAYRAILEQYPARAAAAAPGGFDPARTVARIWRITLDVLEEQDPRAVELLRIAAWYAPTGIPRSLFEPLAEDPVDLAQLLGLLADYNMITLDRAGVGIHRLVQMVARTPIPDDPHRSPERIAAAGRCATRLLRAGVPASPGLKIETWPTWRIVLPHVETCLDLSDPAEDTAASIMILTWAGEFLREHGKLSQAVAYFERSLAAAVRLFGTEHRVTLTAQNNLGERYLDVGCVVPAIELHERTLETRVRLLGPDDRDTLASRVNLANAYERAGNMVGAIPQFEQALSAQVRVLGADHRETLATMASLVEALRAGVGPARVIPLLKQVLREQTRVLGADHPDPLLTQRNLAILHREAGDLERGITLLEQALADCLRVLGEDHAEATAVRHQLAEAYAEAGDTARAIPLFEQTLEGLAWTLGEDDPKALSARGNLAYLHKLSGDIPRAIALFERTLAGCLRVLGEDSSTTQDVRRNLEEMRAQQGPSKSSGA